MGEVLDALQRGRDHRDERRGGVLQRVVVDVQDLHDHVEAVLVHDVEDVVADQLVDQVLAQLRRDLQRVDAQRQQHLHQPLDVHGLEVGDQFVLVVLHDGLGGQLAALGLAVVDDDLVVLAQLDLVVLQQLHQVLVLHNLAQRDLRF